MINRFTRVATAVFVLSTALACGGGEKKAPPKAAPTSVSPSPSPSPSPSVSPTPTGLTSPLTGLPVQALRPVVAVKIDNAPLARPQAGLDEADVVYEEIVEGRTTRFLALYSSKDAPVIGPVRSVRESDLELLRAYGRVLFGFSGGNTGVKSKVRAADVIDVSYDAAPGAYYKAGRRRDAINYMTSYAKLLAARPNGGALPHDVGWKFGDLPPDHGGRPATGMSIVWSQYARTAFKYDPASRKWFRWMDGRPSMQRNGRQMSAPTVVVQYVTIKRSRYTDVNGNNSPYTVTTGSGRGIVYRDNRAIPVTWSRRSLGPTSYRDVKGRVLPFKPGPVWVLLVPSDLRVTTT